MVVIIKSKWDYISSFIQPGNEYTALILYIGVAIQFRLPFFGCCRLEQGTGTEIENMLPGIIAIVSKRFRAQHQQNKRIVPVHVPLRKSCFIHIFSPYRQSRFITRCDQRSDQLIEACKISFCGQIVIPFRRNQPHFTRFYRFGKFQTDLAGFTKRLIAFV